MEDLTFLKEQKMKEGPLSHTILYNANSFTSYNLYRIKLVCGCSNKVQLLNKNTEYFRDTLAILCCPK